MIISELAVYNFRQFKSDGVQPGLKITFHNGLNALVGENDAGKTAVIDAIKLVLLTESNEYIKVTEDDFYTSEKGEICSEFKIDCTISDLSDDEAKNFIEYLKVPDIEDHKRYILDLHYTAWREGSKIYQELRVGDPIDGVLMDGKARGLLKAVYLKPLRDAEREMHSGRNSRISQILINHPVFKGKKEHEICGIINDANNKINDYFTKNPDGKTILNTLQGNLTSFNDIRSQRGAKITTSNIQLKAVLESLSLKLSDINPGLGELNLLFMAAELLLLKANSDGGIKLALIEELEAHLHPQAQLRLISFLQNEYKNNDVQIIISTHSPILASKINIKNLIIIKNGVGYGLSYGSTALAKGDYPFLQRFLDSTKANLFFARGIIMVEGAAENILIPIIAEIIGYPLEKYGISIVNVGGTAFLRYANIFIRNNKNEKLDIPVAIITDCDVNPEYDRESKFDEKLEESKKVQKEKNEKYTKDLVRGFTSPRWTLEYCIALSCLSEYLHLSICLGKKILNAKNDIFVNSKKLKAAKSEVEKEKKTGSYSHRQRWPTKCIRACVMLGDEAH